MKRQIAELLGWYGVIAILGAYASLNFGLLSVNNLLYQFLNLSGAIGIVIDALRQKNYQPAVLNVVWFLIALFAVIRIVAR